MLVVCLTDQLDSRFTSKHQTSRQS